MQLAFKYSKLEVHRVVQPELQMKFSAQALGKAFFHVCQTDVQTKGAKIQLKYQVPLNFWRNHDRSVSFSFPPVIKSTLLSSHLHGAVSGSFFFSLGSGFAS